MPRFGMFARTRGWPRRCTWANSSGRKSSQFRVAFAALLSNDGASRIWENRYLLKQITVHGARQHNLKNIDVEIPRNTFTVITGLSGSGKSSLAFDTIYAEGQRRYVETLSPYARQF